MTEGKVGGFILGMGGTLRCLLRRSPSVGVAQDGDGGGVSGGVSGRQGRKAGLVLRNGDEGERWMWLGKKMVT